MPELAYTVRTCHPGDEQSLQIVASGSLLETFAGTLAGEDLLAHCVKSNAAAVYAGWLADPAVRVGVAELWDTPIGYAVILPPDLPVDLTPTDIELRRIYLFHRFQGSGLGVRLLEWAKGEARAMGMQRLLLGVYGKNDKAIAWYLRQGFIQVGTRQFLVGKTMHDDLVLGTAL
jgi:GNAT superfamily N-acetyltransferase